MLTARLCFNSLLMVGYVHAGRVVGRPLITWYLAISRTLNIGWPRGRLRSPTEVGLVFQPKQPIMGRVVYIWAGFKWKPAFALTIMSWDRHMVNDFAFYRQSGVGNQYHCLFDTPTPRVPGSLSGRIPVKSASWLNRGCIDVCNNCSTLTDWLAFQTTAMSFSHELYL